jgi:hypothetical protein
MAKKNYWTSKAGKAAIRQAAATDAAGAMRVAPAERSMPASAGMTPSRAPNMGIDPGSLPNRSTARTAANNFQSKLVSQGPTTGFGSFRSGGVSARSMDDINMFGPMWKNT